MRKTLTSFDLIAKFYHIPLWMPLLLFAVVTAGVLGCGLLLRRLYDRRRRLKIGLCLTCGYDLRGSNERCPECGTVLQTG